MCKFQPSHFLRHALRDHTALVGFDQGGQVTDQRLLAPALVGVAHQNALGRSIDILALAGNVLVLVDGLVHALKRLVGAQDQPAGVIDQCVAGYAGALVVGTAEAAVNNDEPSAALDGAFPLDGADRDMAVHDVAALAGQAKFAQNMLGGARVGNVPVVGGP